MQTEIERLSFLTRWPLRLRRQALRAIWRGRHVAGRLPALGLDPVFKYALRVSSTESARLESEIVYHDMLSMLEWAAILGRSRAGLVKDADSIVFDNPELLRHLSQGAKPVIFAPLHMGCFALPFGKMMRDHFADRPMLILRAREDRPEETEAMQRISEIGIDMRFLNVSQKQNYVDAVRFARAGAVIVSFADLPASYGGAVPVNLFGRPAALAMGIQSLARLTDAAVVPLSVDSSTRGDLVRFGRPFECYETGPDEKIRVADMIRRHIEQSVLATPAQWHLWPRFNEFIVSDHVNEAA